MSNLGVSEQLKMTCRMGKASWAVWLILFPDGWILGASAGLNASRRMVLGQLMDKKGTVQWLAGSLSSGRARSRVTRQYSKSLGCERIYIFPNSEKSSVLMVGADDLNKPFRDFFKVLSLEPDADMPKVMAGTETSRLSTLEIGGQASYNVNQALDQVLEDVVPNFPGDGAYLTIRQGDVFLIEAVWNCESEIKDFQISIRNSIIEQITNTSKAQIVHNIENLKNLVPPIQKRSHVKSWLGIPLGIGQRVIGLIGFISFHSDAFNKSDLYRANELARYIAPSVENILAFAEAARYLKRLALLNEMASAASISFDVRSVARRVLRMLRRTFQTDRIGLMLIEENGKANQVFVENKPRSKNPQMPLDSSLTNHVLKTGMPVRIHSVGEQTDGKELVSARSALAVPLKYRGNVIGVLGLETTDSNLFSQQDEQLVMVIASHLAGLIENVYLNEETRARARNLSAIHEVVQQIVGLSDISRIAEITAGISAERFEYELSAILLLENENRDLIVEGVGGVAAKYLEKGFKFESSEKFSNNVIQSGQRVYIQKIYSDDDLPINGWKAGSRICVPLREGEQVFGVILVERREVGSLTENDLIVLESLAGILSSVLMNARRYNQLQEQIKTHKITESRLIQSARLAAVGEMAASVAHELNNPLTTITGFAELILEDLSDDSVHRDDMALVLREARRARGVVRRLLDFSRQGESLKVPTDINEILGEVLALIHHLARSSGVEVRFEPWDDLPLIRMDRGQIKQVVLNLSHNALQAMPNGGTLILRTTSEKRDDRDWIVFRVVDSGEGIEESIINRIFEPFFTTKPVGAGTGLGLSISYSIVSDHGGFIDVESNLKEGSCFTIWLPVDGSPVEEDI